MQETDTVAHQSLTQSQIEERMQSDVDHIVAVLGVNHSSASLLLRYFRWDKVRLTERAMDNLDLVLIQAGLPLPTSNTPEPVPTSQNPSTSEPCLCKVCLDEPSIMTAPLPCGHKFCESCWISYVTDKIDTGAGHWITCMEEGCSMVAPNDFIASILAGNIATWERFRNSLVQHFVSCNQTLKFCPYPSCTNTISCPAAASKSEFRTIVPIVSCDTSDTHKFCFGCSIDADHRPVICAVANIWLQKCQNGIDAPRVPITASIASEEWIASNAKKCSKCRSPIEKNGGCNHMTCRQCKHEFCWVCMGPWSEHGRMYSCNRYGAMVPSETQESQAASLHRYHHYYRRWINHEQSARLSTNLYNETKTKIEDMPIELQLRWKAVSFMKVAVDEVFKCRTTLKWMYAMAYYLESGNMKVLFEDNQQYLENGVEELSELIESPLEPTKTEAWCREVSDMTVYVRERNKIMLQDTAEGFREGRWKWNVIV